MFLVTQVAVLVGILIGVMVLFFVVGGVLSLFGHSREDRAKWEAALQPDPQDPDGLAPVVRLVERELEAALKAVGTPIVDRTVKGDWISCQIAGTGVTVTISAEMVAVGDSRLEALDSRTPEGFSADAVALARRVIGKPLPAARRLDWRIIVTWTIVLAIVLWLILALPAPTFVAK